MICLEAVVSRWSRATKYSYKIPEDASLTERSETLGFGELVRVDVFSSRFSARHQEYVIAHERSRVTEGEEADDDKSKWYTEMCHGGSEGDVLSALIDEHLNEAGGDNIYSQQGRRGNKCEEVSVVAFSDTVVQPDAMMVVTLDAVVAHPAVVSSRWSPDVAGSAVFHGKFKSGSTRVRGLYLRPVDC